MKGLRTGRAARGGFWLTVGVLVGLGLAELIFSLKHERAFPHLNIYVPDARLGARLAPGSQTRLRIADNPVTHVRINEQGYRGGPWPPPAPGEVLLVGDSQAFGLGVAEEATLSALLTRELGRTVLNLGVPTYGPLEYRAVLEEIGRARRPAQVVLVINMANDLFEVNRPNRERHAVWDGWAVRKETAPERLAEFPGRRWLFGRSHAVFELRRFFALRDPKTELVSRSTLPSEASFQTFAEESQRAQEQHQASLAETQANERAFREARGEAEGRIRQADAEAIGALLTMFGDEAHRYGVIVPGRYEDGWVDPLTRLRAARASPGDIVGEIAYGEATGPYVATARAIRDAARFRASLEEIAHRRQGALTDAKARQALAGLSKAHEAEKALDDLLAAAPKRAVTWSPLRDELEATKRLCDEWGAELVVVVLPLDVQVSEAEWKKYGPEHVSMAGTEILNDDVVSSARALGIKVVTPLAELRAAEPGAFLNRDLHLTEKGNRAVAGVIERALARPHVLPLPRGGLPEGRKRVPSPWDLGVEAIASGSSAAGCETYFRDEWFRMVCVAKDGQRPLGAVWQDGAGAEAAALRVDDALSILVPVLPGTSVRGVIVWEAAERALELDWPAGAAEPNFLFGAARPRTHEAPATPELPGSTEACRCAADAYAAHVARIPPPPPYTDPALISRPATFLCARELFTADARCLSAYAGQCTGLLACLNGDPWYAPSCEEGFAAGGALERCLPQCGPAAPCASGATCRPWQGADLCFPN